jgi:hypothetical protein
MKNLFNKQQLIEMVRDRIRWNQEANVKGFNITMWVELVNVSNSTMYNVYTKDQLVEIIHKLDEEREKVVSA